jgi:hypothetical protein
MVVKTFGMRLRVQSVMGENIMNLWFRRKCGINPSLTTFLTLNDGFSIHL